MSGGSIHDFLHQQKGVLSFPSLLRVAIDVSKGMDYLHQKNIIHRDLKAANLLMDEYGVGRNKFLHLSLWSIPYTCQILNDLYEYDPFNVNNGINEKYCTNL